MTPSPGNGQRRKGEAVAVPALAVTAWTLSLAVAPVACAAQNPTGTEWAVRTLDVVSAVPLAGVFVSFPDQGESRFTDSLRVAQGPRDLLDGSVRIAARGIGYADLDTIAADQPRHGAPAS